MSGTMSQADLVADLRASLLDSAAMFTNGADPLTPGDLDFQRHLAAAAEDLPRFVPEYIQATLTLVADQALYDMPEDLRDSPRLTWGEQQRALPAWDPCFPGKLPTLLLARDSGERKLRLSPAPTQRQIALLGATAPYSYVQRFAIGVDAVDTTVPDYRRGILLFRAQAEAMKELAVRGIAKPVQLRDGVTQGPRNATPAALYDQFMRECERQAA